MTIEQARNEKNMSRKEVAEWLEIPYRTLTNWENGERPCPAYIEKLIVEKILKDGGKKIMGKQYNNDMEKTRAMRIKADAGEIVKKEGINGYAMMWLNLTNNQKSNRKDILKIYNDYDNGIYVVCDAHGENVKEVVDYLERLGLVIEYKEEVLVVQPEEVFDDDLDVELIEWW